MSMDNLVPILWIIALLTIVYIVFKRRKVSGGIEVLKTNFLTSKVDDFTDYDSVEEIIEASGYEYDYRQDIYYSTINPWQRNFGYCRLYDESAAPLSMIIDCEPIYFEYDNKKWLIEFWKGQYGLALGCEIGVYVSEVQDLNIPGVFNGTFYKCADDLNLLKIYFSLQKNGETLFERKDKHWWLTGFKLGDFSNPSELSMDIEITLKDKTMCDEFVKGLKNAGYLDNEIKINVKTVKIIYDKPRSVQPFTRTKFTDYIIQYKNRKLCEMYKYITKDCEDMECKIEKVKIQAPNIYKSIINIGKNKRLFEKYNTIKDYLK